MIASLHWSAQQTAMIMIAFFGYGVAIYNMVGCMNAMTPGPDGSQVDPDTMSHLIGQVCIPAIIGFVLFLWYHHRKKKYKEEHSGDSNE